MKRMLVVFFIFLLTLSGCSPTDVTPSDGAPLRCLSFNVLAYDPDTDRFPKAASRGPAALSFLKEVDCDIIGLQEATDANGFRWVPLKEIFDYDTCFRENLGNTYEFYSITEADAPGEGLIIAYRKDRFERLDCGAFEYSTFTDSYFHWVKLKDKKANRTLFVVNTHLSPNKNGNTEWGKAMRLPQSKELANFLNTVVGDAPLIAPGDYNCRLDNPELCEPHQILQQSGRFFSAATEAIGSNADSSIDHIYFNIHQMTCESHTLCPARYTLPSGETLQMSDHRPVLATFTYL